MSKTTEKRRLEFIEENVYDELDKDVKDELLSFRRLYNRIVKKEGMVDNLQMKIKVEKDKLMDMREELTERNGVVDTLRKEYSFSISLIDQPPRGKNKIVYYNLSVSRTGCPTKNISLGRRKQIKEQLLEHYKSNPTECDLIKRDWEGWLWGDIMNKKGMKNTYHKIRKMIKKNPLGFNNEKINRDTLYPI